MATSTLNPDCSTYIFNTTTAASWNTPEQDGRADGEVIKMNETVANLEAEASTVDTPAKVLRNYGRTIQADRKCIFVVDADHADRLENIITDPVNRRGDDHEDDAGTYSYYTDEDGEPITNTDVYSLGEYRILTADGETVRDHAKGQDDECPKLDEYTPDELATECMYRDNDGHCSLLDAPCVLDHNRHEETP